MDIANTSAGSGMDVDDDPASAPQPEENEDSDDEDVGDPSDVAMVPMADMLNARYGSENVGNISANAGDERMFIIRAGKIISRREYVTDGRDETDQSWRTNRRIKFCTSASSQTHI